MFKLKTRNNKYKSLPQANTTTKKEEYPQLIQSGMKEDNLPFNSKNHDNKYQGLNKNLIITNISKKNLVFNGNIYEKGYSLSIVNQSFLNTIKDYVKSVTIYDNINENETKQDENNILMFMGWPPLYSENYKICVNFGWEESHIPDYIIDRFQKLDYITVMSHFVKNTLINNGLKIPIYVTNLGYDHKIKSNDIELEKMNCKIQSNKKFKLLHISSCFKRKGIHELLDAYFKGFNGNDDICLYIKTFNNIHNQSLNITINTYKNNHINPPEIIVNFNLIKEEEIVSLINDSSCLINTSNSEGYGLPALEGIIKKKPVIITKYSGFLDFCNDENSFLVDYDYIKSESHFNNEQKISYYAKPKVESIINNIKKVISLSSYEVNFFVEKSYNSVKHLTWNNNVKKNIEAYQKEKIINIVPKIGVICNLNDNCGIGKYNQELFKMDENIVFLISKKNCKFTSNNIKNCWNEDEYTINGLLEYIIYLDVIIIVFHPEFYSYSLLKKLIITLKKLDKIILIEFHCIDGLPKKPEDVYFLRLCDRIILHRLSDMNYLKTIYDFNNFLLLTLPVNFNEKITNKNTIKINNNIKSICSFGFCGRHKGITNLIIAFLELNNPDIILNIYTSYNPGMDKNNDYINEIRGLAHNKSNINLLYSYLEDNELFQILKENDLIVFPTLQSNESASASIRNAINCCKPILISNSKIYTEFFDCDFIYKYDDYNSIQSLKNKLEEVLSYKKEKHLDNSLKMLEYCKNNSFDNAYNLIMNVIKSLVINKNT